MRPIDEIDVRILEILRENVLQEDWSTANEEGVPRIERTQRKAVTPRG